MGYLNGHSSRIRKKYAYKCSMEIPKAWGRSGYAELGRDLSSMQGVPYEQEVEKSPVVLCPISSKHRLNKGVMTLS